MSWKEAVATVASDVEEAFDDLKMRLIRAKGRSDPLQVLPYRGFGTPERLRLRGRVLEDEVDAADDPETFWQNLQRMLERVDSDELPGARVGAGFGGERWEAEADEEGYFAFDLEIDPEALDRDGLWQEVELELLDGGPSARELDGPAVTATGAVVVPRPEAEMAIVSDVDDTVVRTGAADRLKMARIVFLNNAASRMPFPGVAAFYRALAAGADGGRPKNPIFYVSSSPWNYYDLFVTFLDLHDLPPGPFLLKDYGLSDDKLGKSGHAEHKLDWIGTLADTYPDLPFLLVGDSGQRDAWIYRDAVRRSPERFRAVYIRDVTGDARHREVRQVIDEIEELGVPVRMVETTLEAARHAAGEGWIPEPALDEIDVERERDEGPESLLEKILG